MRVLFFNYEYPPLGGGAANATAYLLQEFAHMEDLEVELVTASIDSEYHREILNERVIIHRLPIGKNTENLHFQSVKDLIMYSWKAYWFSRKLAREEKFDVIHSFFTVPCGAIAWALRKEFRIPYIVSLRGSDVPGYSDRFAFLYHFLRPITRLIWRGAASVVSNSQGLKDLALQTDPKQKIDIIYNGVDIQHFCPAEHAQPEDNDRVWHITLGASRITDRKGIRYLIEALDMLREKYRFSVKIIGDGNARERLETLVQEKRLGDQIAFIGRVPREETLPYYQAADVFVLPSLNEGMSNAMLEALACGLPILSTRTGGADELVKEGQNGLFIKPRDAKSIVQALETLIEDNDLRQRMGRESRSLAERMSWENVAKEYHAVYRGISNF